MMSPAIPSYVDEYIRSRKRVDLSLQNTIFDMRVNEPKIFAYYMNNTHEFNRAWVFMNYSVKEEVT